MALVEVFSLVLVCFGGGTAVKPDNTVVTGSQSGSYDYGQGQYSGDFRGTVQGQRTQGYTEQVDLELSGDSGRIRLPRVTLPLIRGGDNGWFKLRNVSVEEKNITANASVNFMNRPKINIDRTTGIISIAGKNGTFTGQCERVEVDTPTRF